MLARGDLRASAKELMEVSLWERLGRDQRANVAAIKEGRFPNRPPESKRFPKIAQDSLRDGGLHAAVFNSTAIRFRAIWRIALG